MTSSVIFSVAVISFFFLMSVKYSSNLDMTQVAEVLVIEEKQ